MAVDSSIPPHHTHAANNNNNNNLSNTPSSPASASASTSTLTREHLQQHNQRQQHQHQNRPAPVRPICTTLPRFNNNNQQRDHHDDTPTTATVNNALATAVTRGIDLSEPETARTLFSPTGGDGDLEFPYNKHTSEYPSRNPFDDPSSSVDNTDKNEDEAHRPVDSSLLTQQQLPEEPSQEQQPWSNGRHPQLATRKYLSLYTRLFRLDNTPATHSSQIVHSTWLWTGALFSIRFVLFLYAVTVLLADIVRTDRPQFEFCYLTQLSYLGLISYLGTVSWHTLSEWRRERGLRAIKATSSSFDKESGVGTMADMMATTAGPTTTIERQHWFLTDMNFFLYHTICTFHVIVPILFWGYLAVDGQAHTMAVEKDVDALWRNYSFHGGDLIIMLLEISINSMPFIPSHVLIVYFVCLLYLAEAHLVHFLSGEWIYPFLDTSVGPIWVAMYFGVGVAIGCAFVGMYCLHRGRNWWFARRAAAKVVRDASAANVGSGETAVPEMVVVTSSIPTVHPGTHLQSTFSSSAAPLPSGTILISTTGSPSAGDYVLSSNSNNYSHSRHHNSIMTHTNTSTALFPTAAPPSTILTSGGATAGCTPTLQPLSIPTQILIQSRRRSYSNCSNDSTTSTLVGSDEGMTNKDKEKDLEGTAAAAAPISERTARRLSMNGGGQPQVDASGLQKVDEEEDGCETETEGDR